MSSGSIPYFLTRSSPLRAAMAMTLITTKSATCATVYEQRETRGEREAAMNYMMVIQWSDEDQKFIVSLPEWEEVGLMGHTAGGTYEEAARMGQDLIAGLIHGFQEEGKPLPQPRTFAAA